MTNTLGPVMLAGLGIFVAWLAITGRASAVASAITGAAPAQQTGGADASSVAFTPPDPAQVAATFGNVALTQTTQLGGASVAVPTTGAFA